MTALLSPPSLAAAPSAAVSPAVVRLSEEEFLARYTGTNAELVDGIVKEVPMAGWLHGMICTLLARLIGNFVEEHDLGRVMNNDTWVRIRPGTFRGADVFFISYTRLPKGDAVPEEVHDLAPELVVEVKSPTDRWIDLFAKVGDYLKAGVLVVVVVDPETRTASAYRLPAEQTIFEQADTLVFPDVLPGFSVPVARLFA